MEYDWDDLDYEGQIPECLRLDAEDLDLSGEDEIPLPTPYTMTKEEFERYKKKKK